MIMNDDWKAGYKLAVLSAFVRQAGAVRDGSYYSSGNINYDLTDEIRKHLQTCPPAFGKMAMPVDSDWEEFMGTFYEGDTTVHGLDTYLYCECGKYKGEQIRLRGTFSELLTAILKDD
jgi:hypothetical protein